MEKKLVIVSGVAGNLGKAVVLYFLSQNWNVVGLERHILVDNQNENFQGIVVDLLNESATQTCIKNIINEYGRIDALVHTVGGFTMGNIASTTIADIAKQYQLNFETSYNLSRPIFIQMQEQQQGELFFIGSLVGKDTTKGKGITAYSLTKSLLFQLANIINAEAEGMAIKAHVVVPSIIDTPQNREAMPNANFSTWEKPEQIAQIIGHYLNKEKTVLVVQEELDKI